MSRMLPTLVVPREAAVPPGAPTAPEWTATKGQAAQAAARAYDVEAFFAVTATRADAWQAAIDSAYAGGAGVGRVVTRTPEHVMTKGLTARNGVYLEGIGSGAVHLDFSGVTTPVGSACIFGAGSLTTLPALAAGISRYANTISFVSAPSVVPGDTIYLNNSVDGSFNPARAYYRKGERVIVKSVSGTTVTLNDRTYDSYPAATTTASRLNPIRTGITGMRMTFKANVYGILTRYGSGLVYDDLVLRGSNWSHLMLECCCDVALDGVHAWDNSAEAGLNYGVSLVNCQAVALGDVFLETSRHGLTLTGRDVPGNIVNRDITVKGGRISGLSLNGHVMGANLHGNSEWITIECDLPRGIAIAGDHTRVRSRRIRSGPDGQAVYMAELLGWDHQLDVSIDVTAQHRSSEAVVQIMGDANTTRTGGRLVLTGDIDMHAFAALSGSITRGVLIQNGGSPLNDVDVDVVVRTEYSDLAAVDAYAVNLFATDNSGFRDVNVKVTTNRMGVRINCSPRSVVVDRAEIYEAPRTGLNVLPIAVPFFTDTEIVVRNPRVRRAGRECIALVGSGKGSGKINLTGGEATTPNRFGGGTAATGACVSISNTGPAVYRGVEIGDRQATPTAGGLDNVENVTTLYDLDNLNIGNAAVTGKRRVGVTTTNTRAAY